MKTVYILRSLPFPANRYIGTTSDVARRLLEHNHGESPHTARFRPWSLLVSIHFDDDRRAQEFERYLKTGSGQAFAKKHLG